jgi:spermidine synthase
MTLRVKKVLHTEKSLYQDVLVFESTDHGNVLVLDGAIQVRSRFTRRVSVLSLTRSLTHSVLSVTSSREFPDGSPSQYGANPRHLRTATRR